MESILEFDQHEIKSIKKALKQKDENGVQLHQTFAQYAALLFEASFQMLLSQGAKTDSITLFKQMSETQDDALQVNIDKCLELTLTLCAQLIKQNTRGAIEFSNVLKDLGVDATDQMQNIFLKECVARLDQINNVYENNGDDSAINQKYSKKHPLNLSAADEHLMVSNPRLVDVDWRLLHTISSKNLNKIFQPRFQLTLTMLT